MRAVLLAVFLATPALAERVPGADDPAFLAPFQRALATDDPTALTDLHSAAQAGNTAALLALPAVSDWLRPTLPFAERKKLGRINGTPVAQALAAADPTAALWALGDPGTDMDALLARAFALYAAGEPDKATFLFTTWVNQTGGFEKLPPDFFDQPVPPWAMAYVLQLRLQDITLPPESAEALLIPLLKADDPAGWIALAGYAALHRPDFAALPQPTRDRIARIITATGLSQPKGQARMERAAAALRSFARIEGPTLDLATAQTATALFHDEPEFQPLLALCSATCPQTADQCAIAFVAGFGHPFGRVTQAQPFTALIPTSDFFATPRGKTLLLRSALLQTKDSPATSPALAAARQIDACLADAILASRP